MKTSELRKQDDAQLIRLIEKMRMDKAESYGLMAQKAKPEPMKMKSVATVDPKNRFRRLVIARCLTLLRERGVKVDA